ncbi:MAG: hypothetical protein QHH14_14590 [Clostridiales bacterium]|nr:hypothetical protein [Clostridiales bacterium]
MEAIRSPFDDFDLVINAFQLPGVYRKLAVIQSELPPNDWTIKKGFEGAFWPAAFLSDFSIILEKSHF